MSIPGQRLSYFAEFWKQAGADPALLSLVKDGHKIKFDDGPPPCTLPLPQYETKLPEPKMAVIRSEIKTLLEKGAIRRLLHPLGIIRKYLLFQSLTGSGVWS